MMDRIERIEKLIRQLLIEIGEDVEREGLRETPRRVAQMLLNELLYGYRVDPKQFLKTFSLRNEKDDEDSISKFGEFVLVTDIPIRTLCEHHLLPILGIAHIAYIPEGKVLGLSKFMRIVDVYARRLQIQERLTEQIADFIYREISPKGVMVVAECIHLCVVMRGVKEPLKMVTVAYRGQFAEDPYLRTQVLLAIAMTSKGRTILRELEDLLRVWSEETASIIDHRRD